MLAARRLTAQQLRDRLVRKAFAPEDIDDALQRAHNERYLDDALYAELYLETQSAGIGDRRLIGNLVKRGIDRDTALSALQKSSSDEAARLATAYAKLRRTRANVSLPSAARALERLGFPATAIYRFLQAQGPELFDPSRIMG
jgi:SOS response regulatory protein OraA/RecX